MIDSTDVVAEIIEPQESLAVSFAPAKIEANFATLRKQIEQKVSLYSGATINGDDEEEIKAAKKSRASLNAIAKDLASRRLAIKNEYMTPYSAFEKTAKEIELIAKSEADTIGRQITDCEARAKENKRANLAEFYTEYAPALVPNVPYSKIHDDRWLLKSTKQEKAEAEIIEKVEKVASDWESLKSLKLKFADACEVKFFDTLDLGAAVAYNDKLVSDGERIAAMRQEVEHNISAAEHAREKPIVHDAQAEEKRPYIMVLEAATVSQIREAGRILGSYGITGTFKVGTLTEVYARSKHGEVMPHAV